MIASETSTRTFLIVWKGKADYIDFAPQELKSLLSMYFKWFRVLPVQDKLSLQFSMLEIKSDEVPQLQHVIDRSVMIRTFLELYSQTTKGIEGVVADLAANKDFKILHTSQLDPVAIPSTYCIQITGEYKSITVEEQKLELQRLSSLNFSGVWTVPNPDKQFILIHNYTVDKKTGTTAYDQSFFGLEAVKTLKSVKKSFNSQYSLANRAYLGPTTTDHDMAFLMVQSV